MKHRIIAAFGLSFIMMTGALHVCAEEETIALTPPEQMPAAVGTVSVWMDSSMNGMSFELHRVQEEGEFVYYSYKPQLLRELTVTCPVWEGDYILLVTSLSDESNELLENRYEFSIADPENDPKQSFDESEVSFLFDVEPTAPESGMYPTDLGNVDRVLKTQYLQVFARSEFELGDLNADGEANAADAADLLIAAASLGAGNDPGLTSLQMAEADLNGDGLYNSSDASELLRYAAEKAAGNFDGSVLDFVLDAPGETDAAD